MGDLEDLGALEDLEGRATTAAARWSWADAESEEHLASMGYLDSDFGVSGLVILLVNSIELDYLHTMSACRVDAA